MTVKKTRLALIAAGAGLLLVIVIVARRHDLARSTTDAVKGKPAERTVDRSDKSKSDKQEATLPSDKSITGKTQGVNPASLLDRSAAAKLAYKYFTASGENVGLSEPHFIRAAEESLVLHDDCPDKSWGLLLKGVGCVEITAEEGFPLQVRYEGRETKC